MRILVSNLHNNRISSSVKVGKVVRFMVHLNCNAQPRGSYWTRSEFKYVNFFFKWLLQLLRCDRKPEVLLKTNNTFTTQLPRDTFR